MKKQVYVLASILMVLFAFYSVYYYSNYRVRNLPIIASVSEYENSQIVRNPSKDSLSNQNLLYSPCLDLATNKVSSNDLNLTIDTPNANKQWVPKSEVPNKHCIFTKGRFTDTTEKAIQNLQTKWFNDDFKVTFDLKKDQPFIFSHFYHLVIFKNQLRHYNPGLVFGSDTVKAVHGFGSKEEQSYQTIKRYRSTKKPIITIQSENFGKLVLAKPEIQKSLYSAYRSINQTIQKNKGALLKPNDHLIIPLLDFHLTQQIPSLAKKDQTSFKGIQKISLTMNAEFSVLNRPQERKTPDEIIFDEPFLVYYQKEEAQPPNLLAWISKPELLLTNGR